MSVSFSARCELLPVGHWHCAHGHVIDCPRAWECPRMYDDVEMTADRDEPEPVSVVVTGWRVWLYASEFEAERGRRVLRSAGQATAVHRGLSAAQLAHLLADLGDVVVADLRGDEG